MGTKPVFILLYVAMMLAGCSNKDKQTGGNQPMKENHVPAGPQYTARYDVSTPAERIDVESAIGTSSPVRLSQVASQIDYYAVGDDKYPITDVVAVDGGFIALNQPKLYLYRKGVKRKRVGLKTEYGSWSNSRNQHLYYDKGTTSLYAFLRKISPDSPQAIKYIGALPPLDSVLARVYYLYPDSLPGLYFPPFKEKDRVMAFNKELYAQALSRNGQVPDGIITHSLNGDTICQFPIEIDKTSKEIPEYFGQYTWYERFYWHNNMLTFRISYNDTIYRLTDKQTITPAFYVHLGKYKQSLEEAIQGNDRKNKAWMKFLSENNKAVFLNVYKEGKSSKQSWITDKAEQDGPSADYKMVYLKSSKKTMALPVNSGGLVNDLDEGLPFWPGGQTDEYLYMIKPAAELKKSIRLTGSPRQKELKAFLDEVADDQNVMIVVR